MTTGMFIAGNMSTGICATLTTPRMAMIRQATMMRYGVLMSKSRHWISSTDFGAESPASWITLGPHLGAVLESGTRPHDNFVALLQLAGADFDPLRRLDAELNRKRPESRRTIAP